MEFHEPVLLKEVIQYLDVQPGQIVVDATLGGAGHSVEIAARLGKGTLIGIDWDEVAIAAAQRRLSTVSSGARLILSHGNYKDIAKVLAANDIQKVDGILADIGISSFDLEQSGRGFSFQKDEPLDMRFDMRSSPANKNKEPLTAKFILHKYEESQLVKILNEYGEEKFSKKIARAVVKTRQEREINTTTELFELIKKALPAQFRFKAADSARRVFQALRIEVNKELDNLSEFLPKAFEVLAPGGRLAIISFHSLEDRIVKQYFADQAKGCICPPDFPECRCGRNPAGKILTKKPVTATEQEIAENPRSRPAKLRAIQKI